MKEAFKFLFLLWVLFGTQITWAAPIATGSFSTTWDSDGSQEIKIFLGNCPTSIYWEEIGSSTNNGTSATCASGDMTVTFPVAGRYRVDFSGSFTDINLNYFGNYGQVNINKFRTVEQWGNSSWLNLSGAFQNVPDLVFNATDFPDLSQTTVMSVMFQNATNFNSDISSWDVSNVSDMWGMFRGATAFNQPLANWDMSANTHFMAMFENASAFNQPLNSWDVSAGEQFAEMFSGAAAFNQPLSGWVFSDRCLGSKENSRFFVFEWLVPTANACVNGAIDMTSMFQDATAFNQDISTWNVSNVTDMTSMFQDATSFNQDLSAWRIEDNTVLLNMFRDTALSPANYAAILTGWAALSSAATGIDVGIVSTTYCDTASAARTTLIDTREWSITDLGPSVCVDASVTTRSGGGSATVIGLRQKRLDDLKNSMSSSTAPISEKLTTFVSSLKKFLNYLTTHEAEIKNWTPEESKTVIIVLRDAIHELLKWLPGV